MFKSVENTLIIYVTRTLLPVQNEVQYTKKKKLLNNEGQEYPLKSQRSTVQYSSIMLRRAVTNSSFARRYAGTVVRKVSSGKVINTAAGAVSSPGTFTTSLPTETSATAAKPRSVAGYTKNLKDAIGNASLEQPTTIDINVPTSGIDWSTSYHGLGARPFEDNVQKELCQALTATDIEIKPDGLLYLPEIKYRRVLNKAFGAGGWGLVPRSETIVTPKLVTREYALICHGQLVSIARGEQDYFNETGIPTATEGCKSNALMRCCKDLGIGSELWDPVFIKKFKKEHCVEKFVEHITTKKKKKIWLRKDREVEYPYK